MKEYKRIGDVWGYDFGVQPPNLPNDMHTSGLFSYLTGFAPFDVISDYGTVPLHSVGLSLIVPASTSPNYLDTAYFVDRSYNKIISPLVERVLTMPYASENGTLTDRGRAYLANIIRMRYGEKWDKIYSTLKIQYKPLENYSMTEKGTDTNTNTKISSGGGAETLTHGKKTTTSGNNNGTENEKVYGFNSSSAVPFNSQDTSATINGTVTDSGDDKTTFNNNGTVNDNGNTTHELTRSGNIGVTTSQQMLEAEMDVRAKYIYLDIVFNDIDSVLTLPIY